MPSYATIAAVFFPLLVSILENRCIAFTAIVYLRLFHVPRQPVATWIPLEDFDNYCDSIERATGNNLVNVNGQLQPVLTSSAVLSCGAILKSGDAISRVEHKTLSPDAVTTETLSLDNHEESSHQITWENVKNKGHLLAILSDNRDVTNKPGHHHLHLSCPIRIEVVSFQNSPASTVSGDQRGLPYVFSLGLIHGFAECCRLVPIFAGAVVSTTQQMWTNAFHFAKPKWAREAND